MDGIRIKTPLDESTLVLLHAGEIVLVNGIIYGARDAAHARIIEAISHGELLPFPLEGQLIYYVGPAPAKPGAVIGPAGPTTSGRMDPYTMALLEKGVKGFIGKGSRSADIRAALVRYHAVYLAAVGGAAALLSEHILTNRVIAYEDLGPEAVHELYVKDFPVIVVNDIFGEDAYINGQKNYSTGRNHHGY